MAGRRLRHSRRAARGFTLLEVLAATALLGFALLGLFALQNVAIGSNRHAGRLSSCMMLAQQQMEYLMGIPYPSGSSLPTDLALTTDPTTISAPYAHFAHPTGVAGTKPSPINSKGTTSVSDGPLMFYRTWDVSYPFSNDPTVLQIMVRVSFYDNTNGRQHGITVSSFRSVDLPE